MNDMKKVATLRMKNLEKAKIAHQKAEMKLAEHEEKIQKSAEILDGLLAEEAQMAADVKETKTAPKAKPDEVQEPDQRRVKAKD